ncbi:ankyrin repeat-containing domain, PGG domain, Gag-polypeptide of LTR copia-type [Artemisia annua]|uniref:Ankyrin repeat-containing domain, PGG domain, Gag-polypeptide of LTR copia-type n=1 Tax=Artemisia annua TaxID=35608 RepID=A0A2U1LU91_ARTAN|nr:ankyrin repeat-containing domain, PGG domain, Gag-polypeptide of LTR copia-type [Artemisia annua]
MDNIYIPIYSIFIRSITIFTLMSSSSTSSCNSYNDGTQEYAYPSHVNAASFLSIKLSGKKKIFPWREQMTGLLESHDMLGFLHGNLKNPQENGDYRMKTDKTDMVKKYREWKRSVTLVKGWIFGSLTEGVMGIVVGLKTANQVWIELNKTYNPIATTTPLISTNSNKGT